MAVVLDIIQSGSTSATLHVQPGDAVTLELASTVENPVLASKISDLQALGAILGITFAINTSGGAT
jgi:hypothetical protein